MIFTARQLEELHRSNGHVTLPYRARLTPLAQAETVFEGRKEDVSVSASVDRTPGFERVWFSRSPDFYRTEVSLLQGQGLVRIAKPDDGILEKAKARIAALSTTSADEAAFIEQASQMLADFLGAEMQPGQPPDGLQPLFPALIAEKAGVQLIVPLRYSPGEVRYLLLGARRGGRRYLSEDLQAAERLRFLREPAQQLRAG